MELASKYNPEEVEGKWYQYWTEHHLFSSKPDGREPYTIVIPPPNVTGVLHMGHMLNNTIQDILVRKARLEGKNACWVPGTDHASIATEAKVVNRLAEKGIKKRDLTREQFLEHAWDWTHEHGGIILKQLRHLGASCDWDRTAFTMDEKRSESVLKVFVDLYRKGLIYRGLRMVNWDPKAQTVLSTEEVKYRVEKSHLYYLRYYIADADTNPVCPTGAEGEVVHRDADGRYYAVVATTRMAARTPRHRPLGRPRHPRHRGPLRRRGIWYGLSEGDAGARRQRLCPGTNPPPGQHRHLQPRRHPVRRGRPLRRSGPDGRTRPNHHRPAAGRTDGTGGGLRKQRGLLRAQPRYRRRTTPVQTVVPVDEALCRHRPAARAQRRHQILSHQVRHHLPELARDHSGLVHLATAVVGTPHPGLVPADGRGRRGEIRRGPHHRGSAGAGKSPAGL